MAALKVILWILVITLVLVLLGVITVVGLLSVKVGTHIQYDSEGLRLKLKYGLLGFNVISPDKKKKDKKSSASLLDKLNKPKTRKLLGKVKKKASAVMEKKGIEREISTVESLTEEKERIQKEEARLNAEMKKAEEKVSEAEKAEKAGSPLPDVVDESQVSKLASIKEKIDVYDLEGAYDSLRSFADGFNSDSVLALLSFIGSQTKGTLKKIGKRFVIKQFAVDVTVSGEDAAKTAIKYGAIGAVAFPALEKMVTSMTVREYDLNISPDFLACKDRVEFHNKVNFRPIRVLAPFLAYGLKVGKKSLDFAEHGSGIMSKDKAKYKKESHDKLISQTAEQLTATPAEN